MKIIALLAISVLLLAACAPIITEEEISQARESAQQGSSPKVAPLNADVLLEDSVLPYEFVGIEKWYNIDSYSNNSSLARKDLLGEVVLVDIWTYSCINCIRTLPYITSWDEKYRDSGLVIVGIHSPEFEFEKIPANVEAAIRQHDIKYPVGLDNDMATWKNYNNRFWPHTFLFDRNGNLVYDHIGEGGYDKVERKIQDLLAVEMETTTVEVPSFARISTPEIYLGGSTNRGNTDYDLTLGKHSFTLPDKALRNTVQLGGDWIVNEEFITSQDSASLRLFYHAKAIHVVASGEGEISGSISGVAGDSIIAKSKISGDQLYTLSSTDYKDQTITLKLSPGISLYAFTFG